MCLISPQMTFMIHLQMFYRCTVNILVLSQTDTRQFINCCHAPSQRPWKVVETTFVCCSFTICAIELKSLKDKFSTVNSVISSSTVLKKVMQLHLNVHTYFNSLYIQLYRVDSHGLSLYFYFSEGFHVDIKHYPAPCPSSKPWSITLPPTLT